MEINRSIGIPGNNFLSTIFPTPAAPYNVLPYFFALYLMLGAAWFAMIRSVSAILLSYLNIQLNPADRVSIEIRIFGAEQIASG